ncbi:hypothetical protein DH2020_017646 [Rehmannia glutinosa]|uniref:Retrotransposon Copia-like N-terminal domain-containing protein n=1 Tax=Rehmannia glutinosa TaxID=99300 RepID=A0ABR0WU59_REHGL
MNNTKNRAWNLIVAGDKDEDVVDTHNANQVVVKTDDESLHLHGSDHPGLVLVSNVLTGANYYSWRRSMIIALGAKTKIGFINGKTKAPAEDKAEFEAWKKVDWMVISWILNSISKELTDSFIYANSAKELWDDLAQRFGESNGPLLYQLQKEISMVTQGNLSLMAYFTKLKKLWDEYASLVILPECTCGAYKMQTDLDLHTKLMQFLMGLNESYDHVRNQILLLDPLPTVNKAYSMLLSVEKQRHVQVLFPEISENTALLSRSVGLGRGAPPRNNTGWSTGNNNWSSGRGRGFPRRTREEKAKLLCSHCQEHGHEKSECFRLHGYPDWYKKFKEQRGRSMVHCVDTNTQLNSKTQAEESGKEFQLTDISNIIKQELAKIMSTQHVAADSPIADTPMHYAHFVEYAGMSSHSSTQYAMTISGGVGDTDWILDTGASKHMCVNQAIMSNIGPICSKIVVYLPDGSSKLVTHGGQFISGFTNNVRDTGTQKV